MGRKWQRIVPIVVLCAMLAGVAAIAVWRQGRSVVDLAGISGREDLRDIYIMKIGRNLETTSFYRDDPELAEELAGFLGGLECRYHHSGGVISYGETLYGEDGKQAGFREQALYHFQFYGEAGEGAWLSESISVLDDGRVYVDGKCYDLKKGHAPDCITACLEEILREYPENAVIY